MRFRRAAYLDPGPRALEVTVNTVNDLQADDDKGDEHGEKRSPGPFGKPGR